METLLLGLAAIVVLGVAAQWLSWRLRLPAILILLLVGFVAGPVSGFIDPDHMLGELLFPIVSLSVAIILFEGGLSLDISELKSVGGIVRNLVSVGAIVTWALSAGFAYVLLGLPVGVSVLLGAILVVTGPTVIIPLLRHIRPRGRVGQAIKWEGIVIDPIGAILAVLVFEVLVIGQVEEGATVATIGVLKALGAGILLGGMGAGLTVILLRRYWVPDWLQSPAALGIVIMIFAASNAVQTESGLLAVTVMGSALASQKVVSITDIVEFKENLRVLLISSLFVILAARVEPGDPDFTSIASWAFVGVLILVVRPAATLLSTLGSVLTWRERAFLSFMAPRGIVAAAVSALFALELAAVGYVGAERIASITFVVIVGTVAVYGIASAPVARLLGVATPDPQGIMFVGASEWVRDIAVTLRDLKYSVCLVDSNWSHVTAARQQGLSAHYGNVLSEPLLERLDLSEIGRLVAVTPNDEVNTLAGLHLDEVFERSRVFQLPAKAEARGRASSIPRDLQGRVLFDRAATFTEISGRYASGARIRKTRLTEEFDYDDYRELHGDRALTLFVVRENGTLVVQTATDPVTPRAGQTLVSLIDGDEAPRESAGQL